MIPLWASVLGVLGWALALVFFVLWRMAARRADRWRQETNRHVSVLGSMLSCEEITN